MSTRIYANGVRATAITNIVADLASYLSYSSDGVLTVNREGLKNYLITQFEAISTTPEYVSPATASSSLAAARALSYDHLVDQLDDAIGVNHWAGRTDWPTGTDVLQGASLVSAVKSAIAACKHAADAVTNYYADINSRLSDFVTNFYYGQGIDSTVTPGVTRIVETRAVIHTYVSDRGEESAPSPASTLVELDQNDTATYALGESVPTGRHITKIRWYRSRSANIGSDYAFVEEVDSGTTSYTDSKKAEELGEPCPTITWAEPPATMIGVVDGPNGAHAGFFDNTFCPSENFVNYAYPEAYQKTTAWPIVGIGVFANTYVVTTRGKPYFVSGADSSSLDIQPIDSSYACTSRRSIVNINGGVVYACPDGLALASVEGVKLITEGLFSRDEWQALDPASIFAAEYHGSYVFHCTAGCYALYLPDMTLRTIDASGSAFFRDLLTDTLYIASGTTIKSLFTEGTYRTGTWKSKKATSQRYENWGWAQVYAAGSVTLKVWRDGVLTDTKTITDSKPVRLSSKRALEHEVQIESASDVTSLTCANTSSEMRQL